MFISYGNFTYVCKKVRFGGGTTPVVTKPPTGYCPKHFVEFQDYCYFLGPNALDWQSAITACQGYGTKYILASVHSMKENAFIASLLYADKNQETNQVWLGGSNLHTRSYGFDYRWTDYTDFNVDNWAKNEPNDVGYTL